MTVSYSAEFSTSTFAIFFRVLWRWKASLYSLVWKSILVFAMFYILLYFTFVNLLTSEQQSTFMDMAEKAEELLGVVPLAFILGFYTDIVLARWWLYYNRIPYPDRLAFLLSGLINKKDERSRLIRRTIMRYINLGYVNVMRSIAIPTKKRFPTMQHLVIAGLLQDNELQILDTMNAGDVWWIPIAWAATLIKRARTEGYIASDYAALHLIEQIKEVRGKLGGMLGHDYMTLPLVYTQVVVMAVYSFCVLCLFGRQTFLIHGLYPNASAITNEAEDSSFQGIKDYSAPFKTILQYAFYLGWLKAAEVCLNPMGEDEDDFPVNWMIDRNIHISYLLVDDMYRTCPKSEKDVFWDGDQPAQLPYTEATKKFQTATPFEGSAANFNVEKKVSEIMFLPPTQQSNVTTDGVNDNPDILISSPAQPFLGTDGIKTKVIRRPSKGTSLGAKNDFVCGKNSQPDNRRKDSENLLFNFLPADIISRSLDVQEGDNISLLSNFPEKISDPKPLEVSSQSVLGSVDQLMFRVSNMEVTQTKNEENLPV